MSIYLPRYLQKAPGFNHGDECRNHHCAIVPLYALLGSSVASKSKSPSFLHEFLLVTTPKDNQRLNTRIEAGRYLTAAVVSDSDAQLIPVCPEIEVPSRQSRLIQRKMARSLRATNPDNYDKDGKVKPGRKQRGIGYFS